MAFVKCLNLLGNVGDFFGECSLVNCEMADFLLLTITLIIVECSNSCLYKLIIIEEQQQKIEEVSEDAEEEDEDVYGRQHVAREMFVKIGRAHV